MALFILIHNLGMFAASNNEPQKVIKTHPFVFTINIDLVILRFAQFGV